MTGGVGEGGGVGEEVSSTGSRAFPGTGFRTSSSIPAAVDDTASGNNRAGPREIGQNSIW